VSTLAIASFSPFTLGSTSPANPLPVTWENFHGFTDNGKAVLEWTTASEKDNAFFEVQRSASGKDFTAIGVVTGSALPASVAKMRKIPGVTDVSSDHPVDIGPPGAPVS
jgi:hypothetical protein